MLRKVECYLMPAKLDPLRDLLVKMGVEGMTVSEVRGFGTRSKMVGGIPQFEDRVKAEIVVDEAVVDSLIRSIKSLVGAGTIGAGMIFVLPVEDALRLSTREAGKAAVV
jgi:nitrogen regulatory protein P-II 1